MRGRGLAVRHSGHAGVTSSLTRGLLGLGIDFRLNPLRLSPEDRVGILSGAQALRWATRRKQPTRYVVGPNIHILASEDPGAFLSDKVSRILVPSEWVLRLWSTDMPEISHKLMVWACGVDFAYWNRGDWANQNRRPLLYSKVDWPELASCVADTLQRAGLDFHFLSYGSYTPSRFRSILQQTSCVIYLGGSESQGIALLESWAMDVPTFVFDAPHQDIHLSRGRTIRLERGEFSPAPYLSPERGAVWSTQEELMHYVRSTESFTARERSRDYFSDESRAAEYAEILATDS